MKKKRLKITLWIFICVLLLDFIPIKFAKRNVNDTVVFVTQPKIGPNIEWGTFKYKNGKVEYDVIDGYIVEGNSPDNILNKRDFNKIDLFLLGNGNKDYKNKFLIYHDEKTLDSLRNVPTYKIITNEWDIIYPVNRASFRRYYAPKGYLTIYDYDWWNFIRRLFT